MKSLRIQLLISHLLLVVLLALVMSAAVVSLFSLTKAVESVLEGNFRAALGSKDLSGNLDGQRAVFVLLEAGRGAEAKELFESGMVNIRGAYQAVSMAADSDFEARLSAAIGIDLANYEARTQRLIEANQLITQPGFTDQVKIGISPLLSRLIDNCQAMADFNAAEVIQANERAREEVRNAAVRSIVVALVAVALALLLTFRIQRMALQPLALLARHAQRVAGGDLDSKVELPSGNEIGVLADSFNDMVAKLAEVRHAEERRLQRAERMIDAALEHLYDPVVVTDAKGRLVYQNKAAEGLFGPRELSRRIPIAEHIPSPRLVRGIERSLSAETISADEDESGLVQLKTGDAERTYRFRVSPMKNVAEQLLGSVVVLEDVTHLRVLDRMKNEFIGVASHELRTPVASMLLSVDLLQDGALGPLNEAQKEVVDTQRSDLDRLQRLMKDLLDVTKLEAGSNPPRLELLTPEDLLKQPVQALQHEAKKKGVELRMVVPPEAGTLRADRIQVGRVVTNLVANAIRHTPAGGKVEVVVVPTADEVTFEVADTGEGIPPDYLKRIFERFVQVPGATQGGAGLGLSIAQHIVKAHGGRMNVRSTLGEGSTFIFTLPRNAAPSGDRQA